MKRHSIRFGGYLYYALGDIFNDLRDAITPTLLS